MAIHCDNASDDECDNRKMVRFTEEQQVVLADKEIRCAQAGEGRDQQRERLRDRYVPEVAGAEVARDEEHSHKRGHPADALR